VAAPLFTAHRFIVVQGDDGRPSVNPGAARRRCCRCQ
jgi:hypothetical protein